MTDNRFVLAFYGVTPRLDLERYLTYLCEWFTTLGFPPDTLVFGEYDFKRGSRVIDFKRASARLRKRGFSSVQSLEIHASLPTARLAATDYYASSSFCRSPYYFAVVAVPGPSPLKSAILTPALELARILKPAYGIAYQCHLKGGPVFYAMGIGNALGDKPGDNLTGAAFERARSVARWGDIGIAKEVYRLGLLRDVYPLNFLSQVQLARPVGKSTLESWIEADPSRGSLQPFEAGLTLWDVDQGRIAGVRKLLDKANVIFDWRKDQGIPD